MDATTSTPPVAEQPPQPNLDQDYYTWSQFKDAVLDLCPNDNNRMGMDNYLPKLIREATIDLQQFIPAYQKRHETLYFAQDMVEDGRCSVGTLPPKSDIQSAWLFDFCTRERLPVWQFPWEKRFELVYRHRRDCDHFFENLVTLTTASVQAIDLLNRLPILNRTNDHRHGLIAVDPQHEAFYLTPSLRERNWVLSLHWHGKKLDFKEQEFVPFDEEASYAVASWVKSKIAMEVDRDQPRSESFMRDYLLARTNLFIDVKDRASLLAK